MFPIFIYRHDYWIERRQQQKILGHGDGFDIAVQALLAFAAGDFE